jgi:phosphoribosylformimino-5-aminoimidazole carboxamide ribotide isomerase
MKFFTLGASLSATPHNSGEADDFMELQLSEGGAHVLIIPAVDIKSGKCVRLSQGRMDAETVYSDDPAAMARQWERAGAELIHVVDLDGAVAKTPVNVDDIRRIVESVGADVQVGGGIRTIDAIKNYIDLGVKRIVIGTEAIRNPGMVREACRQFPGSIVIGIDARNGRVAIEGWTHVTDVDAVALAREFQDSGVAAINFTDIYRDGMQTGPNIEETRRLAEAIHIPVVASGGVSTIRDIANLLPLEPSGVVGIITGRALYAGSLSLEAAIALAANRHPSRPGGTTGG